MKTVRLSAPKIASRRIYSEKRGFLKKLQIVTEQFTIIKKALNTDP
jgi:hypothetical protein